MNVRVRFAPSPTGFLHIGGARTALFNWLYARRMGGVFLLRIEDTDASRNTTEATQIIFDALKWLGLTWDEGPGEVSPEGQSKGDHGPYFQSQRKQIYQTRVEELKSKGLAYDHEGAVKFKMRREPIVIPDLVVGDVKRELTDREAVDPDFVIVRSDGQPVFHLVNVIDDLEMAITHVIRGEDHLSNTSKHIALFEAFGAPPPKYAHIPLILNPDGTKMSKRDKGASLTSHMEQGYAPEAVVNYLCLLGWSPKDDRQLLGIGEVVDRFDLPQILRHNARFDHDKLDWLNYEHLRSMPLERFCELAKPFLASAGVSVDTFEPAYVASALSTCRDKVKRLTDLPPFADFYFAKDLSYDPEAAAKQFVPENGPLLEKLTHAIASVEPYTAENIQAAFKALAAETGTKVGALVHPARLACTGKTVGPSLYHLMAVLGKERTLQRLQKAASMIQEKS